MPSIRIHDVSFPVNWWSSTRLVFTACISQYLHACNNEVKKKLFVSYCTSLYCSALWSTYTPKRVMEEIHIAHNDVYRLLFKLPRGLSSVSQHFVTAGIPNFTMIRRRHMYSLYKRILSSSNVIINAITDSFTFISTLYQEWRKELF